MFIILPYQVYENTRKHSLQVFDSPAAKKKMFASTFELREYENFVRANGFDPEDDSNDPSISSDARSSTLPRKNFSCQDISRAAATLSGANNIRYILFFEKLNHI